MDNNVSPSEVLNGLFLLNKLLLAFFLLSAFGCEMYLYGFTEAALTDAAKPGQLEAVCRHQQMLCHGAVQIAPL